MIAGRSAWSSDAERDAEPELDAAETRPGLHTRHDSARRDGKRGKADTILLCVYDCVCVRHDQILDEGATHISDMLRVNTTLVSLTLLHNSISQVSFLFWRG